MSETTARQTVYAMGSAEGAQYLLHNHEAKPPIMLSEAEQGYFDSYTSMRPTYDWFPGDLMELARLARLQVKADRLSAKIDWENPSPKMLTGYLAVEATIRAVKIMVGLFMTSRTHISTVEARRNNMKNILSEANEGQTEDQAAEKDLLG